MIVARTASKKNKIFKFLLTTDKNVITHLQMDNGHKSQLQMSINSTKRD